MLRRYWSHGLAFFACVAFSSNAWAACVSTSSVSTAAISDVKSAPDRVIGATSGAVLVTNIRNLAASDVSTVAAIISAVPVLSKEQLSSIGTGLAQAASVCSRTDAQAAESIQEAVIASSNETLIAAFRATVGDIRTASVAPAAAAATVGAGGGLGGPGVQAGGNGGAVSRGPFSTLISSFANSSGNFNGSGNSISLSSTNSRTLSVISGSVSPSRSR